MYQRGSNYADAREILCLGILWKNETIQIWLKSDKNIWNFTGRHQVHFIVACDIKWPQSRSLRVQWYQAVGISEEVQTLSERTTFLRYSTSCSATNLHAPDWSTGWVGMMNWKGYGLKRSLEACVLNYYNPDSRIAGLVTAWRRC
jgi:hypothetical protein